MSCEFCTDPDGAACFPVYGLAPHRHVGTSMIGSTVTLPQKEWPANFTEDPECPGMGVWSCPNCGAGKHDDKERPHVG
jgi:hypothetical protein